MMQTTPRAWTDPLFLAGLQPVPGGSATVTDGVATFTAPNRAPIPNMRVALYVHQGGTGDPSPTNIRPITGNDEMEIFVAPEYDAGAEPVKTIHFPQTIYRGTYAPHDGKCLIRGLYRVLTGTAADGEWSWWGSGSSRYARLEIPGYLADSGGSSSRRCSHYRNAPVTSSTTTVNAFFASTPSGTNKIRVHIRPNLNDYGSLNALKNYMAEQLEAETPVQIYVPFADPAGLITVQLTEPQTVYAIKGDNAVWCDGGTLAALDYRGGLHVSDLSMLALARARHEEGEDECM